MEPTITLWGKVSVIATLVQTAGLIISLIFIAYQVWQQTNITRATNVQVLAGMISPLNLKLAEDPALAKLWLESPREPGNPATVTNAEIDAYRYERLMASFLIFYENVYYQHESGWLTEDVYEAWNSDLESFLKPFDQKYLKDFWKDKKRSLSL